MRAELTRLGVEELRTAADVDAAVSTSGTLMIVVNSICGCAAGKARPGVALALQHAVQSRSCGDGVRGGRPRSDRPGPGFLHGLRTVVALDRAAQGRPVCMDTGKATK